MPYWRLFYHVVWATRGREPLIDEAVERLIERSFQMTCADLGVIPHALGFMPEHVHVALSIPPRVAVAEVIKRLKGAASHRVNAERDVDDRPSFAW